jgi:hypothetical protein
MDIPFGQCEHFNQVSLWKIMISCSVSNNDKMTNDMSMAYMFLLNNNNYQLTQPNFTKINIRCYLMQTHEQYK